jgi:hypothetical protein
VHDGDQLFGGGRRRSAILRIDDALADVVLDHLGNEAIQRATAGGRLLQHCGAARLALEGLPHRLHLTTNAIEPLQQLGFFVVLRRHSS